MARQDKLLQFRKKKTRELAKKVRKAKLDEEKPISKEPKRNYASYKRQKLKSRIIETSQPIAPQLLKPEEVVKRTVEREEEARKQARANITKQEEQYYMLRDLYPELSDAEFKRFAKSQFNLDVPTIIVSEKPQKPALAALQPAQIQQLEAAPIEELEEQAKEQEEPEVKRAIKAIIKKKTTPKAKEVAEELPTGEKLAKRKAERIVKKQQEYTALLNQKDDIMRKLTLLKQNPDFMKYPTGTSRRGAGNAKIIEEKRNAKKIDEEIKILQKEMDKIDIQVGKTEATLKKEDIPIPKKVFKITKRTKEAKQPKPKQYEAIRRKIIELESQKQENQREYLEKTDAIDKGEVVETPEIQQQLAVLEQKDHDLQNEIEDWKQKYEAEAGEPIGMGFKKQKKPQLHISRYMIHPDEIKVDEKKRKISLTKKGEKHLKNISNLLNPDELKNVVKMSLKNKGGGFIDGLIENIFS